MNPELIDIGANLTHGSFDGDREAVLARALQAGVRRQIVTGADLVGSRQAAALCTAYPDRLWCTAGIHPHHAHSFEPSQREDLSALAEAGCVVAVGECGLDYFRNISPPAAQRAAFIAQLEIAASNGKPVFLHQRDAHADFVDILRDFRAGLTGGVAHCFTGGPGELADYLALGLFVGITGWVCDERRGAALRESVPHIPADRLLLETDAPYLLPRDLNPLPKTRRNEPAYLPHIALAVAQLRGESFQEIAESSTRNAEQLFALGNLSMRDGGTE